MSSVLYILDENLETLISKNIKAVPSLEYPIAQFKKLYGSNAPPVIDYHDLFTFTYIQRDSLLFVSVVDRVDTGLVETLVYLEHFYEVLKNYLGVKVLDKNIVTDNSVLISELIEETIDFGAIQVTDSGLLADYIKMKVNLPERVGESADLGASSDSDSDSDHPGKHKHKHKHKHKGKGKKGAQTGMGDSEKNEIEDLTQRAKKITGDPLMLLGGSKKKKNKKKLVNDLDFLMQEEEEFNFLNSDIAKTTIMPISWRTKGIHYAKNEFFLNVIEKVEYFMDFTQNVIKKNLIHGEIRCKCFLSGMPNLKVSINKIVNEDKQFLANCKFHQCVSLASLESSDHKDVEFVPPDGEFTLCRYELKRHVRDEPMVKLVNFEVKPKLKKFKLKLLLTIETHFKTTNATSKLALRVPIKQLFREYRVDLSKNLKSKCDRGAILFNISDDFLLWEVGSMSGGHGETQLSMGVEFALFNQEEYDREQEMLKTSMNPPPLREGPKLEELYKQIHEDDDDDDGNTEPVAEHRLQPRTREIDKLLTMDFEVPYCTSSGLRVEYLKIEEPQLEYQSFPWVRYTTLSDAEYAYLIY
ncbi:Apm2p KNAG_0C05550 [Huiozyma naganishii CBS 8797]|uniref:MHD domain-containing protein n=1 Tax=Huiozyma naganishii (strain ATCC MYA-139 / BCRC 22969 / CBS 8797 / KCTC 17520 / NBRC 10181 / NCYC 3082 / Yp74L-3) TaxID=1071383 RepID=J7RJF6_HUIN7|nr:hypothetical protein KNAG_0C05550 [Kazachstania naganishii CBS 8797]CCK69653.1 hypothetical protein KNAG_0C05550 [Kazachstania naganishii CBS 8797]